MSVSIHLSDKRFSFDGTTLTSLVKRVLRSEKSAGKSLNVIYCSDRQMIELNKQYKNKKTTTDVLAFDMRDSAKNGFLGEVYINLQQAKRQAMEYKVPYRQEVQRLTVHGLLHLLGYRDSSKSERDVMWSRQEGYL